MTGRRWLSNAPCSPPVDRSPVWSPKLDRRPAGQVGCGQAGKAGPQAAAVWGRCTVPVSFALRAVARFAPLPHSPVRNTEPPGGGGPCPRCSAPSPPVSSTLQGRSGRAPRRPGGFAGLRRGVGGFCSGVAAAARKEKTWAGSGGRKRPPLPRPLPPGRQRRTTTIFPVAACVRLSVRCVSSAPGIRMRGGLWTSLR